MSTRTVSDMYKLTGGKSGTYCNLPDTYPVAISCVFAVRDWKRELGHLPCSIQSSIQAASKTDKINSDQENV